MLTNLHQSITDLFVKETVGGDLAAIDVKFDAPTRDWVDSLIKPTINFFLFDMKENIDLRQNSFEMPKLKDDGRTADRRLPPRRIDLRYLVSSMCDVTEDEQTLLWKAMWILLKHPKFPVWTGDEPAPSIRVEEKGSLRDVLDLWNAFDARPHPALLCTITMPMDLNVAIESKLVFSRRTQYKVRSKDRGIDGRTDSTDFSIAGVVRDQTGQPIAQSEVWVVGAVNRCNTSSDGRYLLHLARPDRNHKLKLKIKLPSGKIIDKEINDLEAEPAMSPPALQTKNLYDLNLSDEDFKGE